MANRLAESRSDYLLAHADQPVEWWPWGDEAFAEAARRDVPVLASVGYATCHWCHVMARESFSDAAIAARMAAGFVSVKVDREELPEVDGALMAAASAFTRSLGWPLTVFLTPEGLPFFAGTYFPPVAKHGVPGILDVLDAVEEAWRERREGAEETGRRVQAALAASVPERAADVGELEAALASIPAAEDVEFGGLGTGQKFPHAPVLVAFAEAGIDPGFVDRTLDAIAGDDDVIDADGFSHLRGRDGGCFRYATRRDWSEPHFERMLVDNAQLLHAATLAGHERLAAGIVDFLTEVLRQPGGAFAIAEDAESEVDGDRVEGGWHLSPGGPRPALDRLVVTSANGLAIEALATRALRDGDARALEAAGAAASWLHAHHAPAAGLVHASLDGAPSAAPATAADAGALATGLIALARASGDPWGAIVARDLLAATPDPVTTTSTGPALETGPATDGVEPGAPAAMARALMWLHALTGDDAYRARAERILAPHSALAMPSAGASTLAAAMQLARAPHTVVLVGDAPLAERRRHGAILVSPAQASQWSEAGFSLLDGKHEEGAYECEGSSCRLMTRWESASATSASEGSRTAAG